MVHCKNSFGAPPRGGDERRPPCLTAKEKDKGPKKMLAKKKHKRGDADAETAAVAERAKRGVGVRIGDHLTVAHRRALEESAIASGSPPGTTILGGRVVSLTDLVDGTEQTEAEEPTPQIVEQAE
jgi:hypothetical protein